MSEQRRAKKRSPAQRKADAAALQDEKRTALGAGVSALPTGGGIFKSAAVAVLRQERRLMTTGEITKCAIATGLLKCQGKTPKSTMDSALYTDVKRKMHLSVFTRPQEGLFGLREWIKEGFFPEGWSDLAPEPGAPKPTPVRRRPVGPKQARRSSKPRARTWRDGSSDFDDDVDSLTASDSENPEEGDIDVDAIDDDDVRGVGQDEDDGTASDPEADEMMLGGSGRHGDMGRLDTRLSPRQYGSSKRHPFSDLPPIERHGSLHLLAEASKSAQQAESGGNALPSRKRRLTSGGSDLRGDELGTPRSPYEDSLVALHEIATSPISYAPNGIIDLTSRDQQKRRPKHLIVDNLPETGGMAAGGTAALPTPSSLFRGLNSSLATLPESFMNGGSGFIRAPLMLNLPSIGSPGSLHLPDSLAGTPQDLFMGALHSSGGGLPGALLTPHGVGLHGFTPRDSPGGFGDRLPRSAGELGSGTALLDGLAAAAQLAPMRSQMAVNSSGLASKAGGTGGGTLAIHQLKLQGHEGLGGSAPADLGRLAPASHAPNGSSGLGGAGQLLTGQWPDVKQLTPAQVEAELSEIGRVQQVVERLEAKLGRAHPQVGKAWLALARMYQHVGAAGSVGMDRASKALERAWSVCRLCAQGCGLDMRCDEAFTYLQARVIFSGSTSDALGGGLGGADGGARAANTGSGGGAGATLIAAQ